MTETITLKPGEVSLSEWRAVYLGAGAVLHASAAEPIA